MCGERNSSLLTLRKKVRLHKRTMMGSFSGLCLVGLTGCPNHFMCPSSPSNATGIVTVTTVREYRALLAEDEPWKEEVRVPPTSFGVM